MNPGPSAAAAYKSSHFDNAPPLKLLRLMYEGALRFIDQAVAAHPDGEGARFQDRCMRAQAVVSELRMALDPSQAPELAENLDHLYLFCEERLRSAVLDPAVEPLEHAREVLSTLLDGWKSIEVES
jgi:flagellar protein FliS